MNKKFILPVILVTLLGLAVFVSALQTSKDIPEYGAITGNYVESSFKFMSGWNLVHGLPNPDWLSGGDIQSYNIKAIYGFNPVNQEYIRFYPQPERNKLNSQNTRIDSMIGATSFWVYIDYQGDNVGQTKYWTLEPNTELNKQLLSGWNFVSIMPDFINKSFNELKGNCNIEKIYWWQPRSQQFNNILSDKDRMEVLRYSENIGSGLLIKVSNSCTLLTGTSSGSSDIPSVPTIPNIKECTDSDGGSITDVKGLTGDLSTNNAYNDICFNRESATETTSTQECSGDNCYLKEYYCDSKTGNPLSTDVLCKNSGFNSCKNGACVN